MTLDEALKLPAGRTLDGVIAWRLFGWKESIVASAHELESIPNTPADNLLPHYTTSIEAAWQVVECLCNRGMWWGVGGGRFALPIRARFSFGEEAEAETAPLAICRAALKATWKD